MKWNRWASQMGTTDNIFIYIYYMSIYIYYIYIYYIHMYIYIYITYIYIHQLSLDLGKFYDFPKIVRFWRSCRNSCDCEKSCENVWGLCVPQCFSWIICGACVPQCFSWIAFRWHQLDPSNDAWVVLACLHQNGFQSVD